MDRVWTEGVYGVPVGAIVACDGVRICASGRGICGLSPINDGPSMIFGCFFFAEALSKTLFINPRPLFGVGATILRIDGVTNSEAMSVGRVGVALISIPRLEVEPLDMVRRERGDPVIVTWT